MSAFVVCVFCFLFSQKQNQVKRVHGRKNACAVAGAFVFNTERKQTTHILREEASHSSVRAVLLAAEVFCLGYEKGITYTSAPLSQR